MKKFIVNFLVGLLAILFFTILFLIITSPIGLLLLDAGVPGINSWFVLFLYGPFIVFCLASSNITLI